ncbi:BON domain-containing protein [Croceibacterium ferulae]|uniref:BON domain-containing protein n=1 Tax=Croceibacterium ferulae TaxID=1854641 RepID=UPI000EAE190E|nr:BON domain-containing protein [Croceibacterium ferulae]
MNRNQNGRNDRYDNRQNEQFSDRDYSYGDENRSYGQMGESGWNNDDFGGRGRYDRSGGRGGQGYGGSQSRSFGGGQSRGYDTSEDGRSRGGYGASRPTNGEQRGFDSFTSNDFGGHDFSAPRQNRAPGTSYGNYGPYGASSGAGSFGAAPSRDRYGSGRDDERGFFDKAGDTVASWFGDDDAARRREQDHRGSGPANYTRSDQRILEDVCDTITHDRDVDGRQIQVTVQDGEVTLDGTVTSRQQKRHAEDLTHDLSGVKHVQNNLRIKDSSDTARDGGRTSSLGRSGTDSSLT